MIRVHKDSDNELIYSFADNNCLYESEAHEALPALFERASGKCGTWIFLAPGERDMSDPFAVYGYIGVSLSGDISAVDQFIAFQQILEGNSTETIGEEWKIKASAWIRSETEKSGALHVVTAPTVMDITRSMFR